MDSSEPAAPRRLDAETAPELWLRPLRIFSYTVESNAHLYRAIARVFAEAKAHYEIQMRPDAVAAEIRRLGYREPLAREELDRALEQMVEWGNLRQSHDTGRVTTLEDFRRRHFLYQLTPAGEAAERAVGEVVAALASSGSLQSVMLGAILRNLTTLAGELERPEPRPAELYEALFNVGEQFRALTANASTFLTRLHEAIDAGEVHSEAFILYKQAVLEYLEKFVAELAALAPQIARALAAIEALGVERMLTLASSADAAPTLDGLADTSRALAGQWRGMAAWFLGDGVEAATVERLRGAARNAINRILLVLERLHEKRFRRVNRAADLLRLAAWFEDCGRRGDEEAAHRLYQLAFGLQGARHFGGLHPDPERVAPGTSWWQAPAVPVAPVLRASSRGGGPGRAAQAEDLSRVKQLLADRQRRQSEVWEQALGRFAGRGPLELGSLPVLTRDELALLLSLLDRLLSRPPADAGAREARSRDGRLLLRLDAPAGPEPVVVAAVTGRLTLPAYTLTVEDRLARPAAPARASAELLAVG